MQIRLFSDTFFNSFLFANAFKWQVLLFGNHVIKQFFSLTVKAEDLLENIVTTGIMNRNSGNKNEVKGKNCRFDTTVSHNSSCNSFT